MSFKEQEEKVETLVTKQKYRVRKQPDGLYVWAYPNMGQFDSYNFKYVKGFFESRNVEFEVIILSNDNNKPIK